MIRLCPAKVNLALSVGSPDQRGLHPIASWMVVVDFGDDLMLDPASSGSGGFRIDLAQDAPAAFAVDWPVEQDLAARAHRVLEQHIGRPLPVRIALRKRIPPGAGLGGGSSDAASTLLGLRDLFDLDTDDGELQQLAMTLGSDVGFLVRAALGETSCLVSGLGERVEPLPQASALHLVLIFPGFGCPTRLVYDAFDRSRPCAPERRPDFERVRNLATRTPLAVDGPFNDLWGAARDVQPGLATIHSDLERHLQCAVHLSGSGSTLFALGRDGDHAAALARKVNARCHLPAVSVRTLTS